MKIVIFISIVLYSQIALSYEDCTSHPGNVLERTQCFLDEKERSQKSINELYHHLLSRLDNTKIINNLKQSQNKWEKFKEANCVFYNSSSHTRYGIAKIPMFNIYK